MNHEEAREHVKSHIKRRGGQPVLTTERTVRYWWRILNKAVFYDKLLYPVDIEIKKTRDAFAWVEAESCAPGEVILRMEPTYVSRDLFLTVLVHEMVHVWEHQYYSVMGHGKRFFSWRSRIKRTIGLELDVATNESDYRYE